MNIESEFFGKRKTIIVACLFMMMFLLVACASSATDDQTPLADGSYQVIFADINLLSKVVTLDEIEFISIFDTERITQLGLDPDEDLPSGFYIYNESEDWQDMQLATDTHIEIILWGEQMEAAWVTPEGLKERLDEYSAPFSIIVLSGEIIEIIEMYVP